MGLLEDGHFYDDELLTDKGDIVDGELTLLGEVVFLGDVAPASIATFSGIEPILEVDTLTFIENCESTYESINPEIKTIKPVMAVPAIADFSILTPNIGLVYVIDAEVAIFTYKAPNPKKGDFNAIIKTLIDVVDEKALVDNLKRHL